MKLDLLFLEADFQRRELERAVARGGPQDFGALHRQRVRSGLVGDTSIPPELVKTPSKILKVHRERFGGLRWPEFEDLILNYKRTQSFVKGRTGVYTYPTQLAAKYALQLDEPWPEFLLLAKHMVGFVMRKPIYVEKVLPVVMMIARYLVRHNLSPEWVGELYRFFRRELEGSLTPLTVDVRTGEERLGGGGEVVRDYRGNVILPRERRGLDVTALSRILPDLKRLAGL